MNELIHQPTKRFHVPRALLLSAAYLSSTGFQTSEKKNLSLAANLQEPTLNVDAEVDGYTRLLTTLRKLSKRKGKEGR